MGFDKSSNELTPTMSPEMLRSGKSAIAKFGFEPRDFEKFLVSVKALHDDGNRTVITYPNRDIEKYRNDHVKKHEHGLNDTMMFDELAKHRFQDDKKLWHESGKFCPRYFWEYVLKA